jgi:hypothetical protein
LSGLPRQGSTLAGDTIALSETIRLMKEIDEVIDQHGGWPDAFKTRET